MNMGSRGWPWLVGMGRRCRSSLSKIPASRWHHLSGCESKADDTEDAVRPNYRGAGVESERKSKDPAKKTTAV